MSHESSTPLLSTDMRQAAYAAPTATIERQELEAARQQAEKERIANLGDSAGQVLDLEARLAVAIDDRKRAQVAANSAINRLEQVHQTMSAVTGRDTRKLNKVELGLVLSSGLSKLATIADYIERSRTLDDLVTLKRVASNLGVIKPTTMTEAAQLMGLSQRRAV